MRNSSARLANSSARNSSARLAAHSWQCRSFSAFFRCVTLKWASGNPFSQVRQWMTVLSAYSRWAACRFSTSAFTQLLQRGGTWRSHVLLENWRASVSPQLQRKRGGFSTSPSSLSPSSPPPWWRFKLPARWWRKTLIAITGKQNMAARTSWSSLSRTSSSSRGSLSWAMAAAGDAPGLWLLSHP